MWEGDVGCREVIGRAATVSVVGQDRRKGREESVRRHFLRGYEASQGTRRERRRAAGGTGIRGILRTRSPVAKAPTYYLPLLTVCLLIFCLLSSPYIFILHVHTHKYPPMHILTRPHPHPITGTTTCTWN